MISNGYQHEMRRMHETTPDFGVECLKYVDTLAAMINGNEIKSLLDFGAGKGRLVPALAPLIKGDLAITLYDPGVPEIADSPEPAELVVCIDVCEHVEPEYTLNVLDDLAHCTQKIAFITIGLTPAAKMLSDGRNAHINLRPAHEWMGLLCERFTFFYAINKGRSLIFVGGKL